MKGVKHLRDYANLVLDLHYGGKSPEEIVEIVKEKEDYDLSIDRVKKIISLHEEGYYE
jgi:hypothetical protein